MKVIIFISLFLFISSTTVSAENPKHLYKLKIIKKEEREIYGGLGESSEAIACSLDIYFERKSSLSFPCGHIKKISSNWIFIFSHMKKYYTCSQKYFDIKECLICLECSSKENELKKMNIID